MFSSKAKIAEFVSMCEWKFDNVLNKKTIAVQNLLAEKDIFTFTEWWITNWLNKDSFNFNLMHHVAFIFNFSQHVYSV